ncbi:MAG: hypothetical protein WCB14_02725, partial [Candidatus Acidiferrales bacterium]
KTKTPNQEQNQIQSTSRTPLEKTLEADISIWRKTGHFYFALTRKRRRRGVRGGGTFAAARGVA